MPVRLGQALSGHPLDALIADPSGMPPMCDEPQFNAITADMVTETAPRLFAVLQEYGERVDVRIVAWGMAFGDHVEIISIDSSLCMKLRSPADAQRAFTWGSHVTGRLVWASGAAEPVGPGPTRTSDSG
ncbi:hypothetical protein LZ318_12255 [Saccharopolyspora indica]|uniref:hypothetical protein n=1 Tax=Saccharopolyspora indica TaxID=1229659 RepID=UPI0022EA8E8C|nr:hypothetical protein [Saccharopolyspora indica]MDA3643718.1 hypothetical protein [Saccharopolyspora indica]